jgi:hypothetical protein
MSAPKAKWHPKMRRSPKTARAQAYSSFRDAFPRELHVAFPIAAQQKADCAAPSWRAVIAI